MNRITACQEPTRSYSGGATSRRRPTWVQLSAKSSFERVKVWLVDLFRPSRPYFHERIKKNDAVCFVVEDHRGHVGSSAGARTSKRGDCDPLFQGHLPSSRSILKPRHLPPFLVCKPSRALDAFSLSFSVYFQALFRVCLSTRPPTSLLRYAFLPCLHHAGDVHDHASVTLRSNDASRTRFQTLGH